MECYNNYFLSLNNTLYLLSNTRLENKAFSDFLSETEATLKKLNYTEPPFVDIMSNGYTKPMRMEPILCGGGYVTEYGFSDIFSLLLVPAHFLPRFRALTITLAENTARTHVDAPTLPMVLISIDETIGECILHLESQYRVLATQNKIQSSSLLFLPHVVIPGRRFVREGFLTQV